MTDAQFGILLGALTAASSAIVAVVKWSASRIIGALDRNAAAFLKQATESATLAEVLRGFIRERGRTPARGVPSVTPPIFKKRPEDP